MGNLASGFLCSNIYVYSVVYLLPFIILSKFHGYMLCSVYTTNGEDCSDGILIYVLSWRELGEIRVLRPLEWYFFHASKWHVIP